MKSTSILRCITFTTIVCSAVCATSIARADAGGQNCETMLLSTANGDLQSALNDAQNAQNTDNSGAQSLTCYIINQQAANSSLFSFDYGVPHSPAMMLAGLSTDKVTPASSLKPFVFSLPSLLESGGTSTAAAFDIAPAWALGGDTDVVHYDDGGLSGYFTRVWYRTRLGGALSKGDSSSTDPTQATPSRAAIGVNLSLLSDSDPVWARTDADGNESHWRACLHANSGKVTPSAALLARLDAVNFTITYVNILSSHPDKALTDTYRVVNGQTITYGDVLTSAESKADTLLARATPWTKTPDWDNPTSRAANLDKLDQDLEASKANIRSSAEWTASSQGVANAISACSQEASDVAQHGADLQVGAGVVLQGTPGSLSNLADPNAAVWIAGRLPLTDIFGSLVGSKGLCDPTTGGARSELACWTIGGSGRYSAGEMDATGDTTTPMFKANVAEGWVGIERISSTMKIGGYFGYMDQSAVDVADKAFSRSGTRWLFSGAYSLSSWVNGLWVVGSYGNANGSTTTLNDKVALLSLTFGPPSLGSGFVANSNPPANNGSATNPPAAPPATPTPPPGQ